MRKLNKPSFWIMLLLEAYAIGCLVGLLLMFSDLKMPAFSLTHN